MANTATFQKPPHQNLQYIDKCDQQEGIYTPVILVWTFMTKYIMNYKHPTIHTFPLNFYSTLSIAMV